jgi:hypothetical protein
MAEFKNYAVRCPIELVNAVEALLARRRAERPFELVSVGQVLRELMVRGLESVASENITKRP